MLTILGSRFFLMIKDIFIRFLIVMRQNGFRVCDLLIISHESGVSYPTISGCKEESIQITHVYFKLLAYK